MLNVEGSLSQKMEITLMMLSLIKKNKAIDIFREISFSKKDTFLENIMKPEYEHFL